jgi:cystathionine beta-synthase
MHAPGPAVRSSRTDIKESILDAIGGTPLVRLSRIGAGVTPQLVAKVESLNPGGSIKDRVAVALIEAAEQEGLLRPGGTIVEPTSGNTGTGLAMVARLKGYQVVAVMPDKIAREKINLLRAYGARVVVCPTNVAPESPESYYSVSDRLAAEIPGAFKPDQYSNPANPAAHYGSTGPELWEQSGGRITHLVVGVGTGGTITGAARYLKEQSPGLVVVGVDPIGSIYAAPTEADVRGYLVEGVGEDFWPETFDPAVVDRWVRVSDRDSFLTTRELAMTEGILSGGSCGMAVHAALEVAAGIDDPEAMVVVILPDGGRSYLSKIYSDAWMTEYGFLERSGERSVGDVLLRKHDDTIPSLVTVRTDQPVHEAVALLHEHRVSQLPVVSAHDDRAIVGSIGERSVLKHAITGLDVLESQVVDVMDATFPAVSAGDPVRDAIELLSGERQALLVTRDGRPAGILTRSDLLEALAR